MLLVIIFWIVVIVIALAIARFIISMAILTLYGIVALIVIAIRGIHHLGKRIMRVDTPDNTDL